MNNRISIIEVGPRDGLQNVTELLSLDQKKNLLRYLLDCGFSDIEAGSFVRPDKLPSMADTPAIADHFLSRRDRLWYLVPNLKGLQNALIHGVNQIAFFTAASQTFNKKNIGMTTEESLKAIYECVLHLQSKNPSFVTDWDQKPKATREVKIRIYISTVIACPYEGRIAPKATLDILEKLLPLNAAQFSLGDTLGIGVPKNWKNLLREIEPGLIQKNKIAMHCHNTYGTGLACVSEGLNLGIRSFDSSIGGLGGCPFAPGATGNLPTEDLVYFLDKEGFESGIDLNSLKKAFGPTTTGKLCNVSQVFKTMK